MAHLMMGFQGPQTCPVKLSNTILNFSDSKYVPILLKTKPKKIHATIICWIAADDILH
jgi:hypothetical protein